MHNWVVSSKKVPNDLSQCHTKRRKGADFLNKKKKRKEKSKKTCTAFGQIPSFGMTMTQDIRDLFV